MQVDQKLLEEAAYNIYRLLEGDDVTEQAFRFLRLHIFVDENDEWVYPENE